MKVCFFCSAPFLCLHKPTSQPTNSATHTGLPTSINTIKITQWSRAISQMTYYQLIRYHTTKSSSINFFYFVKQDFIGIFINIVKYINIALQFYTCCCIILCFLETIEVFAWNKILSLWQINKTKSLTENGGDKGPTCVITIIVNAPNRDEWQAWLSSDGYNVSTGY